jgi:aspartyl-tRNA(Asn)/glutamyl-tRNA(Gln) amidotransferase subunit C
MLIDRQTLEHTAELARIDLDALGPAEVDQLLEQMERIVGYVHQLAEVDTDGVEPTVHPVDIPSRRRDDIAVPTQGAVVSLAPARAGDEFLIPRFVHAHGQEGDDGEG